MEKISSELHVPVWGTEDWFFPGEPFGHLMFKIIGAREKLSVQVHPADEYAAEHDNGSLGKTEVWYILEAEPGAQLVYGFKEGVSKRDFERGIADGTVEELLNFVPAKAGDVFFITPGLVHALGAGIVLAELQQNSTLTYRVHDYNRKPPREMHVAKALDVVDMGARHDGGLPVVCEYFTLDEVDVAGEFVAVEDCFIFVVESRELWQMSAGERMEVKGKVLLMK